VGGGPSSSSASGRQASAYYFSGNIRIVRRAPEAQVLYLYDQRPCHDGSKDGDSRPCRGHSTGEEENMSRVTE